MTARIQDCFGGISMILLGGLIVFAAGTAAATDSGGPLIPEQAAYDVTFYDLALTVKPDSKTIDGVLRIEADIVEPLQWLVLDLDECLEVSRIVRLNGDGTETELLFERRGLRIWTDWALCFPRVSACASRSSTAERRTKPLTRPGRADSSGKPSRARALRGWAWPVRMTERTCGGLQGSSIGRTGFDGHAFQGSRSPGLRLERTAAGSGGSR